MSARPLRIEEAGRACEVFARIVTTGFPEFPPEAVTDYLAPWTADKIAARIKSGEGVLLGFFKGSELVGLVSGTAVEGGVGTIFWLLVAEEGRGSGAGRALFDAACAAYRAMGAHKIKLTAPTESAQNFYNHMGMLEEGYHANHWYHLDFCAMGLEL